MTICDLCFCDGKINDAPETCVECSADMCPAHGEGEFCLKCLSEQAHLAVRSAECGLQMAVA